MTFADYIASRMATDPLSLWFFAPSWAACTSADQLNQLSNGSTEALQVWRDYVQALLVSH